MSGDEALATVRRAIPPEHVEFLESFVDSCRFGDYLFVHAEIMPGVALEEQRQADSAGFASRSCSTTPTMASSSSMVTPFARRSTTGRTVSGSTPERIVPAF